MNRAPQEKMSSRHSPSDSATAFPVGTLLQGNDGNMYSVVENKNGVHRWQKSAASKKVTGNSKEQSKEKMSSRPSPSASATSFSVGTHRKGNDGNMYTVAENKNGVHRWQKSTAKTSTKTSKADALGIVFGELDRISSNNSDFHVNQAMLKKLQNEPKILKDDKDNPAGYVFGRLFHKSSYTKNGEHGNDGAQTAMVIADGNPSPPWEAWYALVGKRNLTESYGREVILKLRDQYPNLVWMGETFGGDVGASYWAHKNKTGDIDSVIVSVNYFEQDEDDEDNME